MSPVTHFLTGWVLANAAPMNRRDRAMVTIAAVIPDIDGLGILAELSTRHSARPWFWFSQYHHLLHNLPFGLVVTGAAWAAARRRWVTGLLAMAAFHIHLLEDLAGSRGPDGYDWPIPYLLPFTSQGAWTWHGQWALNAWPNLVLTIMLVMVTLWLAVARGFSPLELLSPAQIASSSPPCALDFGGTAATPVRDGQQKGAA